MSGTGRTDGLGGDSDVLLARETADLDEWPGEQLAQLRGGIWRAHQCRADENRVRARELGGGAMRAGCDAALGDDDAVTGCCRDEVQRGAAVDFERAQIACVDPDHFSAELDGAL